MFFKDIKDFRLYIPVNVSFDLDIIAIYLKEVDRTVIKSYLGPDFFDELQTEFDDADSIEDLSGVTKELIELLRECTANLAFAKWVVTGQVNISQAGIQITSTDTQKTAFEWQVRDIIKDSNARGYSALEEALGFLEKNISETAFEAYKDSDEFAQNNYLFITSAADFAKYYSAFDNSRINFFKLRSIIRKVEDFEIKSVILPDYFDDLKTKKQDGDVLGANALKVIEKIKPALAHLVVSKAINDMAVTFNEKGAMIFDNTGGRQTIDSLKNADEKSLMRLAIAADQDGRTYLKELGNYMEKNKDLYPLFANDSEYQAPEDDIDLNAGDRPFFAGI